MQESTSACSNWFFLSLFTFSYSLLSFKKLPTEKIDLHEAYCRRNVRPCPQCGEFMDKSEIEKHEKEQHSKVS